MAQYEININVNGTGESGTEQQMKGMSPKQKNGGVSKGGLGSYIVAQTIEPMINKTKDFIVSNVELNTGSKALQQKIDFGMQMGQMGIGAFKNAAAGFVIAGPAGAGVGVMLSALSFGMDIAFKQAQLNLEKREEGKQRAYLQERMGVAFTQSRRS